MASNATGFETKDTRNKQEGQQKKQTPNAWNVQQYIVEIIRDHFLKNDSRDYGFPWKFDYVYPDEDSVPIETFESTGEDGSIVNDNTKSSIVITSSFQKNLKEASKYPLVVVYRGTLQTSYLGSQHGTLDSDPRISLKLKALDYNLPIVVKIVSPEIGMVEGLAEFIHILLVGMGEQIAKETCVSSFRLESISTPIRSKEHKDMYEVDLNVVVNYKVGYGIVGDDLRIQRIAISVMDPAKPNTLLKRQ